MAGKILIFHHGREIFISMHEIYRVKSGPRWFGKGTPGDWYWSSVSAHMKGKDDILVKTKPLLEMVNILWEKFLSIDAQEPEIELFRKHERTGRPLGEGPFIKKMEFLLNRKLKPQKPGPKKKDK